MNYNRTCTYMQYLYKNNSVNDVLSANILLLVKEKHN